MPFQGFSTIAHPSRVLFSWIHPLLGSMVIVFFSVMIHSVCVGLFKTLWQFKNLLNSNQYFYGKLTLSKVFPAYLQCLVILFQVLNGICGHKYCALTLRIKTNQLLPIFKALRCFLLLCLLSSTICFFLESVIYIKHWFNALNHFVSGVRCKVLRWVSSFPNSVSPDSRLLQ